MTTNKPEVVAWRWRKPVVNDRGETVGGVWKLGGSPAFLSWWTSEPLVRLSDYEALQAENDRLREHLQSLIDQTTPLEPEPDNPMWSRRIQLDKVIAERDSLRAECDQLRKDAERYRWLRDPCSGAERVVTYGRGDYGRGLMSYTMLDGAIDSAMHKAQKKDAEE